MSSMRSRAQFAIATLTALGLLVVGAGPASALSATSVAYGPGALAAATTSTQSAAFGYNALAAVTSGDNNTGVGYGAARRTTTGAGNTALGAAAMYDGGATANLNTTVGLHAGRFITGDGNVAIGADAGLTAASIGETVIIGRNAYAGGFGRVAIGSGAAANHVDAVALGYGTTTTGPAQVNVGPRDVEITAATKGVVLRSPNGTRFRLTVTDAGALTVTALP